ITGTMSPGRTIKVDTQVGSVTVQGGSPTVTYVIKKRAQNMTEERARREFEQFRVSSARNGETVIVRGEFVSAGNHRMSADFRIQAPRDQEFVSVQTRGGGVTVNNIAGRIDGETAG